MAARGGISGLAVALASAGGFLVYAGIRDVPPLAGLRELAAGRLPTGRPPQPVQVSFTEPAGGGAAAGPVSSGLESRIATAARKYIGVPYVWAGHDPATGVDCSGLVTWVLHRDVGIDLTKWSSPLGHCNNTHTVTGEYLVTNGCKTVPRAECTSGDLVCWPGHIGIAVDRDNMIDAPKPGDKVKQERIWGAPLIRRVVL